MGEKHRVVSLLSADQGIIEAIAYGVDSQRGRLRHAVMPFGTGEAFLYANPARSPSKLVDFSLLNARSAIREDVRRFAYASFWSECIIQSHVAGGDSDACYRLYNAALDALECCDARWHVTLASARFVWRFLKINGSYPALTQCEHCSANLSDGSGAYWDTLQRVALCAACYNARTIDTDTASINSAARHTVLALSLTLLHFFNYQIKIPFEKTLHDTHMNEQHAVEIGEFSNRMIESYMERELRSLVVVRQL